LVDLVIVGAQKAATTALLRMLAQHPDLNCQEFYEMRYFTNDAEYEAGYDAAFATEFPRAQNGRPVVAKNAMILHVPFAAQRLHQHRADVQVVALLRDPVRRAYSAFWWARVAGFERIAGFEEALRADLDRFDTAMARANCDYLGNGCYDVAIGRLFDLFGRDRVHIYFDDDIRQRAREVCNDLLALLGVGNAQLIDTDRRENRAAEPRSERLAHLLHKPPKPLKRAANLVLPRSAVRRAYRRLAEANRRDFTPPPMSPATEAELRAYFRPHDERLSALLGRALPWC
jgi:hypothetical protein